MNKIKLLFGQYRNALTGTVFYYVCLILCIIFHIVQVTEFVSGTGIGGILNKLELLMTFALSIRFLVMPKKSIYNVIWLICFGLLFISYRVGDDRTLLDTFVLVTAAYGADFSKITVSAKWAWIVTSAVMIAGPLVEVLLYISEFDFSSREEEDLLTLGFLQHNTVGLVLFSVGLCLFIANYDRMKWRDILGMILLLCICSFLAKSRTSALLLAVLLVFSVYRKFFSDEPLRKCLSYRPVIGILSSSGILITLFSLYMAFFYDFSSSITAKLNILVHGRFRISYSYFQDYDIKLWGQVLPDSILIDKTYCYLDNGYLYILLNCGVIAAIIMLALYTWSLYRALSQKNIEVTIGIVALLIVLMMERQTLTCHISWLLTFGFASLQTQTGNIHDQNGKIEES